MVQLIYRYFWHALPSAYNVITINNDNFSYVASSAETSCGNYNIKYPSVGEYANFNLTHEVNYTLYYAVTLVPILHYNYLLNGYVTGKPITLVYDPNIIYLTLGPKGTFPC